MSRNKCPLREGLYLSIKRVVDFSPAHEGARRPGGEVHPGNDKARYGDVVEQDGIQYVLWSDELDNPVIEELSEDVTPSDDVTPTPEA